MILGVKADLLQPTVQHSIPRHKGSLAQRAASARFVIHRFGGALTLCHQKIWGNYFFIINVGMRYRPANDLLGFAKLAADGNSFSGKTVKLMADIDLNPDWNADVTVGSKVIFPVVPVNTWPNIASFKGTLDGNGYTLSGLYKSMTVSGNKGAYGGLFNTLAGGTVKNLRFSNSLILTTNTSWGSGNIHVGGIAGDVNEGSVLRNVYMDETVEVWFKSNEQCVLGGAYGYANGAHTVSDFIFAGVLGNLFPPNVRICAIIRLQWR